MDSKNASPYGGHFKCQAVTSFNRIFEYPAILTG